MGSAAGLEKALAKKSNQPAHAAKALNPKRICLAWIVRVASGETINTSCLAQDSQASGGPAVPNLKALQFGFLDSGCHRGQVRPTFLNIRAPVKGGCPTSNCTP